MARVIMDPSAYAKMDLLCHRAAEYVTDEVGDDVKIRVTPPMRGYAVGELLASFRGWLAGKSGFVSLGTDHWHLVEFGARPHIITPNGPWPLQDRKRGKWFGFLVKHPGSPEQAPLRKSTYQRRRLPYLGRGL